MSARDGGNPKALHRAASAAADELAYIADLAHERYQEDPQPPIGEDVAAQMRPTFQRKQGGEEAGAA